MVVKLSSFLSTSLADGLDSALVTGIIANTDVALDSGTTGNYVAQITAGDGITVVDGAAHEANAIVRVDSATVATADNTLTVTNKTFNLTNNTLTGTLGQFNAALNGSTFASLDGGETLTNKTLTSPTINTPQIVGPGSFSKITTLGLRDQTTNQFDLRVQSNSSTALTDNRTLTVDVENVNRSVKLGGDLIIDKELRTAGDYNLLMNLTDSTNITLPSSGTVMQFDSNGASTITGAFSAGSLSGHYLGADSDVTELVTKSFVDNLGVDASTLGGRDSDYFLNYNNFTNTPAGSVALASLGVTAPPNPSNGQLWWDDSAGNLYVYYVDSDGDTQWVEAVPQLAAEEYVSSANITNNSTGTTFASNSYNVLKIQTDKDDNGTNDDAILQFTNGSANTVKAELRFDESTSTFEIGRGDNQGHFSMNDSGIGTFSERLHIQGTNVDTGFGYNTYYTYGADIGGMTTISGPNSYDALTVENTSTDFAGVRIRMRDGNSTSGQYSFWGMNSDVVTFNSSNSKVAWQATADGEVTKPNQPAFHAYPNAASTNNWTGSNGDVVPFDTALIDVGSNYDTTNYRYVVPIDGIYLFYYRNTSNTWYGDIGLYKNGTQWIEMEQRETHTTWRHHFDGVLISCSANDYIDVRVETSSGGSGTIDGQARYWDGFGGYLVS